jgi:hypothetical protein
MSFEITGMKYAPTRKLTTTGRGIVKEFAGDTKSLKYVYNPVPYDIDFELNIMVKNAEDGTRILEQILPFFTPEWTSTVNLIPELDYKMDIPLVITNVSVSDEYEGSFEDRRVLTWKLDFTMHCYLFGPIKKHSVITLADTNFFNSTTNTAIDQSITVQPGLTSNGQPTSNAAASIDRNTIPANSDWGVVTTIQSV